jgi:hypothetical protein
VKVGLFALVAVMAAIALVSSSGAAAGRATVTAASLSTREAASTYLVRLGLNPDGFVIERGARNYAGPSCPGKGWTCTQATRVLQIATGASSVNQSETCSSDPNGVVTNEPGDCEIVQVSRGESSNYATCEQLSGTTQKCVIFQTSASGGNSATVIQTIGASADDSEQNFTQAQDATQYAGIDQTSGSGANTVSFQQQIDLTLDISHFYTNEASQRQDALQQLSLTQRSGSGSNSAGCGDRSDSQSLTETATATAEDGGTFTQLQNTQASEPNTNAGITQHSSAGGANCASLSQSNTLGETVDGYPSTVTQTQGTTQGGMNSYADQQSSGVSTWSNDQTENQTQNSVPIESLSQTQNGPMWADPPQTGNEGDTSNLIQNSTQNASSYAAQDNQAYIYCDSAGNCSGSQSIQQSDADPEQGCPGDNSCNMGLIVVDGNEATCGPDSSDPNTTCPPPPGPPPLPQKPSSGTPPACYLIGSIPGQSIAVEVQDDQGLQDIAETHTNATVVIPAYSAGTTDPVIVTATKDMPNKSSSLKLVITDVAGLTTTCDPVLPAVHKAKHRRSPHH